MLVAVYGTLKKDYSNHRPYMTGAVKMCNIVVPGIMFSMYHYPGLILHDQIGINNPAARKFCEQYSAHCEVYSIDADILKGLDQLEGHPDYYMRQAYRHDKLDEIWIYTIKPHIYLRGKQRIVPSGVWDGNTTTVQEVDFGPGHCKPKILMSSSIHHASQRPSLPKQVEDWDDVGESNPLETVFDQYEEPEEKEYDIIEIDVDGDLSAVKEAI